VKKILKKKILTPKPKAKKPTQEVVVIEEKIKDVLRQEMLKATGKGTREVAEEEEI